MFLSLGSLDNDSMDDLPSYYTASELTNSMPRRPSYRNIHNQERVKKAEMVLSQRKILDISHVRNTTSFRLLLAINVYCFILNMLFIDLRE